MTSQRSLAALAVVGALVLSACGSSAGDSDSDGLTIVASTNVYGDVAATIAGDRAEVTSIITSSSQDPHGYEATAQDRLALDGADVVIENGGGYDAFVASMLEASDTDAHVIDVSEISGLLPGEAGHDHGDEGATEEGHADEEGHDHADEEGHDHAEESGADGHEGHDHVEGFNEHVWYDLHTMTHLADELAVELAELDAAGADVYAANAEAFKDGIEELEDRLATVKESAEGQGVAITEPVPLYLLTEAGLENRTPADFSEAIEEGDDVSPRSLEETLALFDGDSDVALLAYNDQTVDSTTERVRDAAEAAGVPVVSFAETLPEGTDYRGWMSKNIDALAAALGA